MAKKISKAPGRDGSSQPSEMTGSTAEFSAPEWVSEREPRQSDMGASVLNYGEQRGTEYTEPGDEGAYAVRVQKANGGISSEIHQSGVAD